MTKSAKRFHCFYWVVLLGMPFGSEGALEQATFSEGSKNVVIKNFPIKVRQGVAVDADYFYAISNTMIAKCDKQSGKVLATWQADRKDEATRHFLHLNSGTVVEGRLYCAHSRYAIDPNDNTLEIWNVENDRLAYEKSMPMPGKYGSLTWVDRHSDGSWWMCYAVYGSGKNAGTRLVKYAYDGGRFRELESWTFPEAVVAHWGTTSCSGGSWGPDGYLYTTGHDHARAYVLKIDATNRLRHVRTEKGLGCFGQGIAWDRTDDRPVLWGIVRNKTVSLTLIP